MKHALLLVLTLLTAVTRADFQAAQPVWAADLHHAALALRGNFTLNPGEQATLQIAAQDCYRVFVNGNFVGCGGNSQATTFPLQQFARPGRNRLAIEASGGTNAFVLAEVIARNASTTRIAARTGNDCDDLNPYRLPVTLSPTHEEWKVAPNYDQWRAHAIYLPRVYQTAIDPADARTTVRSGSVPIYPAVQSPDGKDLILPRLQVECTTPAHLRIVMDNGSTTNTVTWQLKEPGAYTLAPLRPCAFTNLTYYVRGGEAQVKSCTLMRCD